MLLLESGKTMARAGRPRSPDEDRTSHVRVREDLAKIVAWLIRVQGVSSAKMLDPLLRPILLARFAEHIHTIRAIKAAEDDARREQGLPPTDPLPAVAILTGRETPEQVRAILEAADAEHKAFMESGEGEAEAEAPVKPKRKKKSS